MDKEVLLNFIGMKEEEAIHEATKTNLNSKEYEVYNKGKEFIDKCADLENENLRKKVILKLIAYTLVKMNGGK